MTQEGTQVPRQLELQANVATWAGQTRDILLTSIHSQQNMQEA